MRSLSSAFPQRRPAATAHRGLQNILHAEEKKHAPEELHRAFEPTFGNFDTAPRTPASLRSDDGILAATSRGPPAAPMSRPKAASERHTSPPPPQPEHYPVRAARSRTVDLDDEASIVAVIALEEEKDTAGQLEAAKRSADFVWKHDRQASNTIQQATRQRQWVRDPQRSSRSAAYSSPAAPDNRARASYDVQSAVRYHSPVRHPMANVFGKAESSQLQPSPPHDLSSIAAPGDGCTRAKNSPSRATVWTPHVRSLMHDTTARSHELESPYDPEVRCAVLTAVQRIFGSAPALQRTLATSTDLSDFGGALLSPSPLYRGNRERMMTSEGFPDNCVDASPIFAVHGEALPIYQAPPLSPPRNSNVGSAGTPASNRSTEDVRPGLRTWR